MKASGYREAQLRRRLSAGMRLLLPADPGPAAMLDAVREFDPAAKRILPHRIQVDGRSQFYLSRPYPIDAELRRQAGLPPDVTVAYFLKWVADSETDAARYREQGTRLLTGLAARFGGSYGSGRSGQRGSPRRAVDPALSPADQAEPAPEPVESPAAPGRRDRTGRRLSGRAALVRIGLLVVCTVVFFGFAAANGAAAEWPLLAVNALMGLLFTAATLLLAGQHLSRR